MSKLEFKEFVKTHPSLIKHVNSGDMSWQKFYEMFDLYGVDNSIWDKYINVEKTNVSHDALSWIKNIDVDSLQSGINSIQRVIGLLQDFSLKDTKQQDEYKPRPLYKHFDD